VPVLEMLDACLPDLTDLPVFTCFYLFLPVFPECDVYARFYQPRLEYHHVDCFQFDGASF
jgi:hypothetical protein